MTPDKFYEFVSIDPGLRGSGVARWDHGQLMLATYVKNPDLTGRGPAAHRNMALAIRDHLNAWDFGVLEFPRIYPKGPKDRRADPNDLLDLAGVDGALSVLFQHVKHVFPADWKGQVPKAIMNARVLSRLTEDEKRRIVSVGALDHNTLDAVGIGLFHIGRLAGRGTL